MENDNLFEDAANKMRERRDKEIMEEINHTCKVLNCYDCGETFHTATTVEEENAEAIENGFDPKGDNVTICDDCYTKMKNLCIETYDNYHETELKNLPNFMQQRWWFGKKLSTSDAS